MHTQLKKLIDAQADLRAKREEIAARCALDDGGVDVAKLTDEDNAFLRDYDAKMGTFIAQERSVRALANNQMQTEGKQVFSEGDKRDLSKFNIVSVINDLCRREQLSGVALELRQEAEKEAQRAGQAVSPNSILLPSSLRALSVSGGTGGDAGGVTVATNLAQLVNAYFPTSFVAQAGAKFLTGLVGNIDIPYQDASVVPTFDQYNENDPIVFSDMKWGKYSMTPKVLKSGVKISKSLLIQSSIDVQMEVIKMISTARDKKLNSMAYSIFNNLPVGRTVSLGAAGGALTSSALIDMETLCTANDSPGPFKYIVNAKTIGAMKKIWETPVSGSNVVASKKLYENGMANEYPVIKSNYIPSNLVKTTGTGLSAAIFGDFSDLWIGQWGVVELLVNPYSYSETSQIGIISEDRVDMAVVHSTSFSMIKDIIA